MPALRREEPVPVVRHAQAPFPEMLPPDVASMPPSLREPSTDASVRAASLAPSFALPSVRPPSVPPSVVVTRITHACIEVSHRRDVLQSVSVLHPHRPVPRHALPTPFGSHDVTSVALHCAQV